MLIGTPTGKPTEDYILWTEWGLDAVTVEPVDAKSIKDGSTVYAWLGAQTVMTMSLPPQVTPELLLVNIPADFKVPQYDVIVRPTISAEGYPLATVAWPSPFLTARPVRCGRMPPPRPYLTRNRVTYQDLLPGTRVLVWADDEGQASRVIVFPTSIEGRSVPERQRLPMRQRLPTVYPPPCGGLTMMSACMPPHPCGSRGRRIQCILGQRVRCHRKGRQ